MYTHECTDASVLSKKPRPTLNTYFLHVFTWPHISLTNLNSFELVFASVFIPMNLCLKALIISQPSWTLCNINNMCMGKGPPARQDDLAITKSIICFFYNFESVDSIVMSQLQSVDSDLYDPKLLMEIYRNL